MRVPSYLPPRSFMRARVSFVTLMLVCGIPFAYLTGLGEGERQPLSQLAALADDASGA